MLIIIPCRNEEESILEVALHCKNYASVIVVDDNSDDNSSLLLKQNNISFIKNTKRLGYEGSINIGLEYAINNDFESVCFIDGDGEISVNEIDKVIQLSKKYDIIIGNRNIKRRVFEKILSYFYKITFGINDPYCGLKFFKINKNLRVIKFPFNTFSLKILHSFNIKSKKVYNLPIIINNLRKNSRLGSSTYVNFKMFTSVILLYFYILITLLLKNKS